MTALCSYELNGKKLSFANWISWLSPRDTPFVSMTKKEMTRNTRFQWQNDTLLEAKENVGFEGGQAPLSDLKGTTEKYNVTQIFRKTILISDTAIAVKKFGSKSELEYQLRKAVEELKLDMEYAFLGKQDMVESDPRETAGFFALTASTDLAHTETGSVTHLAPTGDDWLTEENIRKITKGLYDSGSRANVIMFPPALAPFFSSLQEKALRRKVFQDTDKISFPVSIYIDQLGIEYKLIPNRWMPADTVYFFNPLDWTQMLLREPKREMLAKEGSSEKWMVEVEVGLRHANPWASGILRKGESARAKREIIEEAAFNKEVLKAPTPYSKSNIIVAAAANCPLEFCYKIKQKPASFSLDEDVELLVYKNGKVIARKTNVAWGEEGVWEVLHAPSESDSGQWCVRAQSDSYYEEIENIQMSFKANALTHVDTLIDRVEVFGEPLPDNVESEIDVARIGTSGINFIEVYGKADAVGAEVVIYRDNIDIWSSYLNDTQYPVTFSLGADLDPTDSGVYRVEIVDEAIYQKSPDIIFRVKDDPREVEKGTLIHAGLYTIDGQSLYDKKFFRMNTGTYPRITLKTNPGDNNITLRLMKVLENADDDEIHMAWSVKPDTDRQINNFSIDYSEVSSKFYFVAVDLVANVQETSDVFTVLRGEGTEDDSLLFNNSKSFNILGATVEEGTTVETQKHNLPSDGILSLDISESAENAIIDLYNVATGEKLLAKDIGTEFSWEVLPSELTLLDGNSYEFMFRIKKDNKYADTFVGTLRLM